MSFPPVLLSIVLAAVVGPAPAVILAIVVIDWTALCRVVRPRSGQCQLIFAARESSAWRRDESPSRNPAERAAAARALLTVEMGIAVSFRRSSRLSAFRVERHAHLGG